MPKPDSFGLLSIPSDPIWMTATDSLHVNTASGAWLYFVSSLAQPEFHPHDCGLLSGDGWPNIMALPESWHKLQMHRVSQGPLTPLARAPAWPSGASRAGASHSSHLPARPPACKKQYSTEAFGLASQLLLLPPHPPYYQRGLICCPGTSLWDNEAPTCCSCSAPFHIHDGVLGTWLVQNKQGCSE